MRSLLNIIAILLITALAGFAQPKKDEADSVKVKPSYKPTGIRFGTDVVAFIKSNTDKTFDGWELNADMDFHRFIAAVDYGYWARDYVATDAVYSNSGTYFRIGADANFLLKDPDKNLFFFGLRYARSKFTEHLEVRRQDEFFGDVDIKLANNNIPASWFELTTGLRVKMWRFMWLGYTARLKFALSTGENGALKPSDVPGYGSTSKETAWGFNYQIFVRIPLRKTTSVPVKERVNKF